MSVSKVTLKDLESFDWKFYIENNKDLKKKIFNEIKAKLHWIKYGRFEENRIYKFTCKFENYINFIYFNIMRKNIYYDIEYTLEEIKKGKSYIRFGDGEIRILKGKRISFQNYSPKLKAKLYEIISSQKNNNYIFGLYICFPNENHSDEKKKYLLKYCRYIFGILKREKLLDENGKYICHNALLFRSGKKNIIDQITEYLKGKNIVMISGKKIRNKMKIKKNSNSFTFIKCKEKNCFSEFDEIFNKCIEFSIDTIFICSCGPCAKVLAYELTKKGYQVIDAGYGFMKNYQN